MNLIHFYFSRFRRKSIESGYQLLSLTEPDEHVFFGYYDKTPFDESETRVLATRVPLTLYQNLSEAQVGYYTLSKKSSWNEIGKTKAWCWQLGTRLQWMGGGNDLVIYNDYINGSYASVIYSTSERKTVRTLDMPVFDVNDNGTEAITLDFSRLHRLRPGYGYMNIEDTTINDEAPESSGIWSVNLRNGSKKLLFSIADIASISPMQSMKNAHHYFNHLMFNPSGNRFLFLHCWLSEGKRHSRLLTCNSDGSDLYPLIKSDHVSHYTWHNDKELLVYARHSDGKFFRMYSDRTESSHIIDKMHLSEDGHPSFRPGKKGNHILLDTYPSFFPEQKLYLYDMDSRKTKSLGAFFSSNLYRGSHRCDLHPRWSPSGNRIAFDSVFDGNKRGLHLLNLTNG